MKAKMILMGMKQEDELKIGELWFGNFVDSELFFTKLSGIDLNENVVNVTWLSGCPKKRSFQS